PTEQGARVADDSRKRLGEHALVRADLLAELARERAFVGGELGEPQRDAAIGRIEEARERGRERLLVRGELLAELRVDVSDHAVADLGESSFASLGARVPERSQTDRPGIDRELAPAVLRDALEKGARLFTRIADLHFYRVAPDRGLRDRRVRRCEVRCVLR